jgi:hypothetical protein
MDLIATLPSRMIEIANSPASGPIVLLGTMLIAWVLVFTLGWRKQHG